MNQHGVAGGGAYAAMDGAAPVLAPLSFPLRGSHLVEASAGTGKTFAIASLYLRLVLGHGGDAAFDRPLVPAQILVVSFTVASTQELRVRIRQRLAQAAACFLGDATEDSALLALRDQYTSAQWPMCAERLQTAAQSMDEAAITTIHGFCQRMLSEHAFDSTSGFALELQPDDSAAKEEAVRDYWRSFIAPLGLDVGTALLGWWPTPAALQRDIFRLLPHRSALPAADAPQQSLRHAQAVRAQTLAQLKAPWAVWTDELQGLLEEALDRGDISAVSLRRSSVRQWLQDLRYWANDVDAVVPWGPKITAWKRLSPKGLAKLVKPGAPPVHHPGLEALAQLPAQLAALPTARQSVLAHAAHWVAERLDSAQALAGNMGYAELLTHLDAALQGQGGEVLADRIRGQLPVAFIDEFQDTDATQYRIFDAIYGVHENRADSALLLIGDPKQAIYRFRGADIYTYLQAKADTASRHATLDTNYRSSADMVAAVNHFFERAESAPEAAFLFRRDGHNPLPFAPVQANGRPERFECDGQAPAALTLWQDPIPAESAEVSEHRMALWCAAEIQRLLLGALAGRVGFRSTGSGDGFRPLRAADIAVLVHTGRQAASVRRALRAQRVPSVYLSEQASVLQSPIRNDVLRWLIACAEPSDAAALRAALASSVFGLSWTELEALQWDDQLWQQRVMQFVGYRERWRRQGVLPMLRRLLHDFAVPQRLLAQDDERTLTDALHLAEWLQEASTQWHGEQALIRHFREQCEREDGESDLKRLRLESDSACVQVVTIHKSKGLEYPLVFIPFGASARPVEAKDLPWVWHDARGQRHVALEPDALAAEAVEHERLGEDVRKLYVALTRARHATWLGVAPAHKARRSALAYALGLSPTPAGEEAHNGSALDDEPSEADPAPEFEVGADAAEWASALHALAESCTAIRVQSLPVEVADFSAPKSVDEVLFAGAAAPAPAGDAREQALDDLALPLRSLRRTGARQMQGELRESWWIASYSALLNQRSDGSDGADDAEVESTGLPGDVQVQQVTDVASDGALAQTTTEFVQPRFARDETGTELHGFARGSGPGSFLHGLLEWAGQRGFSHVAGSETELERAIGERSIAAGYGEWAEALSAWLRDWLNTSFSLPQASALRLAGLEAYHVEMEFWLPVQGFDSARLDRLVTAHTFAAQARPALASHRLNGMLKGYIDLVLEHDGRYYVADYKSNALGDDAHAYTPQAMRAEVLSHRYDMQAALYVLALHRLLRSRLPHYSYPKHMGGSLTWFLRGHLASSQGLLVQQMPHALIDALDRAFAGYAGSGVAA